MAQPTLLSIAKADLITANHNVTSDNRFIKHQAAYLTQQSVEKTLKYLISLNGKNCWGHDIRKLVIVARQLDIYVPDLIVEKADAITSWEANARYYPTKIIRRDVIRKVIREVHKWHKGLANKGIR